MIRAAVASFVLLVAAAGGHAQALVDPTRPPNVVASDAAAVPAENQLQSVLISQGRRVAVINGETVSLGGRIGDATVVRISATEVTLKRGDELEVLGMFGGVEKKSVRRRVPAAEKGQRK
jgi:MSHA biogenesis protein MshK